MTLLKNWRYKRILKEKVANSVNKLWSERIQCVASGRYASDYGMLYSAGDRPDERRFVQKCCRELLSLHCSLDSVDERVIAILDYLPLIKWKEEGEWGTSWLSGSYEIHTIEWEEREGPDLDAFTVDDPVIRKAVIEKVRGIH